MQNPSDEHLSIQLNQAPYSFKAFPIVAMIYVTFSIASMVVAFKVISVAGIILTASAFILPLRFLMGDIIAEVYGFYLAKKMLWGLVGCWYLFSLLSIAVTRLPSPDYWNHQAAYDFVLGNTIKTITATLIAIIIGSNLNIYLVTKWKRLVQGRFFWVRSFFASGIGELVQYAIALPIMYYSLLPPHKIFQLIFMDFSIQLVLIMIFSIPANMVMVLVKKIDNMDVYEKSIRFNPFRLQP